ncbi:MAG: acyltransferase [Methanocorpusculum parvum]|nr:acyltransferase [Methanocorpusculum parvum]
MTAQTSPVDSKEHFVEIDYLRCFAILAVIAIHTAAALTRVENPTEFCVVSLWQDISSFAVPLFICISGFVLYLSYNPNAKRTFYKKRYQRIIPPYLIFTIIYLIANIFKEYVISGIFQIPSAGVIVNAFLFATSNEHMWFFLIIIELYLFYPIFSAVYQKLKIHKIDWILLLLAFIVQMAWNMMSGGLFVFVNGSAVYLSNKVFLCMIFYFILGMYLSEHYSVVCQILYQVKSVILLGSISIVTAIFAFVTPQVLPDGFFAIVYCVSAILLLFSVSRHLVKISDRNIFVTVGLYSFGIYLIHPLIQGLFGYVIYPLITITPDTWIYYPLVFLTTTVLSIFGVYLIKKLPYNQYIIG